MVEVWGTGKAEYFIGGVHLSGYWERETLEDITVYYLEDGTELTLRQETPSSPFTPIPGK